MENVLALGKRELVALRHRVLRNRNEVSRIVERVYGQRLFTVREEDDYRYLVLALWAERYQVSLEFVVRVLAGFWRARFKRNRRAVFGCRLATLIGRKSEEILREAVEKEYPTGEHVAAWKHQRRLELAGLAERGRVRGVSALGFENPEDFVKQYEARVRRRACQLAAAVSDDRRRRRPYRGNPWL